MTPSALAEPGDLVGRQVAVVRVPRLVQPLAGGEVSVGVLALEMRPLEVRVVGAEMPIQASASMMPCVHSGRLRASSVSSMRSTNVPPGRSRQRPVEQRRAGTADVEEAGRRRGESKAWSSRHDPADATRRDVEDSAHDDRSQFADRLTLGAPL